MMLSRVAVLMALVTVWTVAVAAQSRQPRCLHGENETDVQAQRRLEALDAIDLINRVLERRPRNSGYPSWDALGTSAVVNSYRGIAGPRGDLARKIQWGADEPLPGWQIHYVAAQDGYAFSLTDIRDACQLTFTSNDTGRVMEGRPADRSGQIRVLPLDSSH